MFYFEAEKRRLEYLKTKMGNPEDPNPTISQKAKREFAKAFRKLEVSPTFNCEYKDMAQINYCISTDS